MADLTSLVSRLEQVASRLESVAAKGGSGGAAAPAAEGDVSASVAGFDEIVEGALKAYVDQSNAIGGDAATHAAEVARAFQAQRAFLVVASKSKKPADSALGPLLKDTSEAIGAITSFRDAHRQSKQFNHLSAVSEGIPALGWVTMAPKPAPFIKEMTGSAQFYSNRVLKEFKGNDEAQVAWAKSFVQVLTDLHAYVKKVHTTGVVWNPKGGEAAAPAPTPAAAKPKAVPAAAKAAGKPDGALKSGLFAELSKGTGITSGLKKVDRSQMTHKNPELRTSSVVQAGAVKSKAPSSKPKFGGPAVKKDPVLELQGGKKWAVEFQEGNSSIVIDETELKQTVYIYKCNNSTVQVKGKVNSITVDSCKKIGVVFDECVSVIECINSQRVQIQVTGKVPTVSIDKCDGTQVYLSKDSLATEIVSAKSSEMNISVPQADGDFAEFPVPEQFKTVWSAEAKKLVTQMTDIAG